MSELIEVKVPEDQQEGTTTVLSKWLKEPGEAVEAHEPIVEVETDKVVVEISAPAAGQVAEHLREEGDELEPGEVIGRILPPGAEAPVKAPVDVSTPEPVEAAAVAAAPAAEAEPVAAGARRLSPIVRRLIKQHELDPDEISGTGEGGRITVRDVEAFLKERGTPAGEQALGGEPSPAAEPTPAAPEPQTPPATSGEGIRSRFVSHSTRRKSIAVHMAESLRTAPHVTSVFEADLSLVLEHRRSRKPKFAERGVKLTLTAYFVGACAAAIKSVPEVNSRYHDDELEIFEDVNIGVGTALEDEGLVVPVIERVQDLTLFEIASRLQDLTTRAREGKLKPAEVRNGTFTISNHGVSGSLVASPIVINQPQSAILGIGKLEKRVVVREADGQDTIQIRPMCYVTLTIDHRVLDAYQTDKFLTRLTEVLASWS